VKALFALFAKYVKGRGFYVHVSECAPRFVAKKIVETEKRNLTMYDLFHFERGKNELKRERKN